jgi:hypothetical protein
MSDVQQFELPLALVRSNRPPLQEQIDRLERETEAMREALGHMMAAMVPAMQALEHIEAAARAMASMHNDDA